MVNEFDPVLLKEIRKQGVEGLRASHKTFITIPPGNSKQQSLPPTPLLHILCKSKIQQGRHTTCLLDCFSSAMYDFGCVDQVQLIRNHPDCHALNQSNKSVWNDFGNFINRHFKEVGLKLYRNKKMGGVQELLTCDDSFVIIAALKASDGMEGQHAVSIFDGGIYDSNSAVVMKKTQEALDWCCGDGNATCTGIHRMYQLLPTNHREVSQDMRFVFQACNVNDCNVRGWVAGTIKDKPLVQFADGERRRVSLEELGMFTRLTYVSYGSK